MNSQQKNYYWYIFNSKIRQKKPEKNAFNYSFIYLFN